MERPGTCQSTKTIRSIRKVPMRPANTRPISLCRVMFAHSAFRPSLCGRSIPFGPRQSQRAVIPAIIAQALSSQAIRLGSLTPRRDFTFVADTVAGFIAAAEAGEDVIGAEINLGTGRDISIGEVAALIRDQIDRNMPIEQDQTRIRPDGSEVMRLLSANKLAGSLLSWAPRISLEDGISQTISWFRGGGDAGAWRGYAR